MVYIMLLPAILSAAALAFMVGISFGDWFTGRTRRPARRVGQSVPSKSAPSRAKPNNAARIAAA